LHSRTDWRIHFIFSRSAFVRLSRIFSESDTCQALHFF
jgi:hypothetical protein